MKKYLQKGNNSLLILNHKTSVKVFIHKIVLIKANANYTTFYIDGGMERVVAHSLKFFETHLETYGFLRIHQTFMINPNYIKIYDSKQEVLTMSNGLIANISRRRKGILKDFNI
jgi:DNA-binding LytR/AlgR family response regulator